MINIKDFLNLNYYTSETDQFLAEFDERHKNLSASQRAEIEKYQRIYRLRDHAEQPSPPKTKVWEKF